MKITSFAKNISIREKGKTQVSIAQIMEILRIINKLTGGVFYGMIKLLTVLLMVTGSAKAIDVGDQIKLSLLDHAQIVTQYGDRDPQVALVDSVILVGKHKGESIFDIQGGIFGNADPETVEEAGLKWAAQGYLKINPFVRDYVNLADHWKFLNSLKYGAVGGYNFTEKDWYGRFQVGLEFGVNTNQ